MIEHTITPTLKELTEELADKKYLLDHIPEFTSNAMRKAGIQGLMRATVLVYLAQEVADHGARK